MPRRSRGDDEPQDVQQMELKHYSLREVVGRMRPLVSAHRKKLLASVVLVAISGVGVAVMPLLPKVIIDSAIPRRDMRLALIAGGVFLAVAAARMVCYYVSTLILLWVGEDVVFRMRQMGFRHLQRLCLRFHSRYPSGFLYSRVFERAICTIGMFFRTVFSTVTVQLMGLVLSLAVCLWLSAPMTGIIFVGAVGYVFASRILSPRIHRRHIDASDAHNWIAGYILDKLRGTKTIQAFSMEDHVDSDFDRRVWPMQVKWIRANKEVLRLQLVTEALSYVITSAVLVVGASAIMNWGMGLGTLVAFMAYQAQFTGIIASLANIHGQFAVARAGFDQLYTVMDTQSTVVDQGKTPLPRHVRGELEFRNVTFSYDRRPILQDLSFTIPPGQTIALVGRSGGGKTTVTNLLLRFFDPESGSVVLDGRDVRELPLRAYRSMFGVVLQDPFLFNDTIETNLRCAKPRASQAELLDVLRKAQSLEFVQQFPDGLQHQVGEGGSQLSGGQRQRIAIARCMLLQPKFLILDEATSALDNETENLIQKALGALFEDRTAFVIAHRLSTVRRADRLLVIDGGRIVEDGSFDELLDRKGPFRRLYSIATSTSTRRFRLEEAGFA